MIDMCHNYDADVHRSAVEELITETKLVFRSSWHLGLYPSFLIARILDLFRGVFETLAVSVFTSCTLLHILQDVAQGPFLVSLYAAKVTFAQVSLSLVEARLEHI